ncbi:TetR/AcrR family transcriptional regulator [Pedobacter sp. SD-b]|uniref:TetR/AcrR family transcriptional regulator n=1 Tax=Pedobacter segetis TaxID=2793069 RepID=A0ABS1BFZ3_9SPHI|nr:TetR/AcrR family transcriptional regulator [Pedobacter segetis]MBK0381762.1 TetR/AcrR family transcriptional regulator [Pedobacter segetis]
MSKAEKTRQFIIEKTSPIFNTKGYAGTSLNDIMSATGLTKGSIYGNFKNKDEVALLAFDHNFGKIASYIREKIAVHSRIIDKLLVYPETYRNFLNIPFLKSGCPILNTSTEADDTHPMLRKKATKALNSWQLSLEKHIQIGIEKKEIKAETNALEFSIILMSIIEGAVMQAKVTGSSTVLNITMDFLEKMIRDIAQ